MIGHPTSGNETRRPAARGFTLIELLVVIVLVGLLASLSLPALKGFGQSNTMASAISNLQGDLALARQIAMSSRSTVYVVFAGPDLPSVPTAGRTPSELEAIVNSYTMPYTSYILYSDRRAGDQPGQSSPRYIGEWKHLPDGVFIRPDKFTGLANGIPAFQYLPIPFPFEQSATFPMPYIAFDSRGKLISEGSPGGYSDAIIPLTKGSIFYARDVDGKPTGAAPDVQIIPPDPTDANFTHLRIDWLTGRTRVEQPELQ